MKSVNFSVKLGYLPSKGVEFYTEQSPSGDRAQRGETRVKRGIEFHTEWGQKTKFLAKITEFHTEIWYAIEHSTLVQPFWLIKTQRRGLKWPKVAKRMIDYFTVK